MAGYLVLDILMMGFISTISEFQGNGQRSSPAGQIELTSDSYNGISIFSRGAAFIEIGW